MMYKGNKSENLNEFQRKTLTIMHRNISKIETIIDDIFTLYRLELNNFSISKEMTNIVELVEKNMLGLSPLIKAKNIGFISVVNVSGSVLCDPVRISQVFFNCK